MRISDWSSDVCSSDLESQPKNRGYGAQGNVAFTPIQPDAKSIDAIDRLAAHHALVHHGGGIGARLGAGQAKTGDFLAASQARQPVIALGLCAELHQKLARAQGIWHHDRHTRRHRPDRNTEHDLGASLCPKTPAAIVGGYDHAEKAVLDRKSTRLNSRP